MADSFTQIYLHIVFAVKFRDSLITDTLSEKLYPYLSGYFQKKEQKSYIINGMPDHIHILLSYKPVILLPDLIREAKKATSNYINQENILRSHFRWQEGFGAFSVSQSAVDSVYNYIKDQQLHHQKRGFLTEYHKFLKAYKIEYNPKYTFKEPE